MSSEVPEGWLHTKLGEAATLSGGTTPSKNNAVYWTDGSVPWATPSDITSLPLGRSRILATETQVAEVALRECSLRLNPPGTVLMTSRATIGYAVINDTPMATNQGFLNFTCFDHCDPEFLCHWLNANRGLLTAAAGGSTFKELSRGTAKLLPILLPPLDEQRRIAEVLRSVDAAIASEQATSNQYRMTVRTLLEAAFSAGETAMLGDICSLIYRYPGFYGFEQRMVGVPVIRGEHLRAGRVSTDWNDFYFVAPEFSAQFPKTVLGLNDVVMSVRGTVGTAAVVDSAHVGSQISPNLIRLVADPQRILPPLLFFAVQSAVAHIRNTIVNAQALPAINAGDLKRVEIALPARDDQPALLKQLEAATTAAAEATRSLNQTIQIKLTLVSDLLSGRVRVPA